MRECPDSGDRRWGITTDASDEAAYATASSSWKTVPWFHLIDDFCLAAHPADARWRTGVYILNDVSLTLTNSRGSRAPRTPDQARSVPCGRRRVRVPALSLPAVNDDFITMAQTVEVPS